MAAETVAVLRAELAEALWATCASPTRGCAVSANTS